MNSKFRENVHGREKSFFFVELVSKLHPLYTFVLRLNESWITLIKSLWRGPLGGMSWDIWCKNAPLRGLGLFFDRYLPWARVDLEGDDKRWCAKWYVCSIWKLIIQCVSPRGAFFAIGNGRITWDSAKIVNYYLHSIKWDFLWKLKMFSW